MDLESCFFDLAVRQAQFIGGKKFVVCQGDFQGPRTAASQIIPRRRIDVVGPGFVQEFRVERQRLLLIQSRDRLGVAPVVVSSVETVVEFREIMPLSNHVVAAVIPQGFFVVA